MGFVLFCPVWPPSCAGQSYAKAVPMLPLLQRQLSVHRVFSLSGTRRAPTRASWCWCSSLRNSRLRLPHTGKGKGSQQATSAARPVAREADQAGGAGRARAAKGPRSAGMSSAATASGPAEARMAQERRRTSSPRRSRCTAAVRPGAAQPPKGFTPSRAAHAAPFRGAPWSSRRAPAPS